LFSTGWDFLKGVWAVVSAKPSKPSVTANRGSVAVGGDIKSSPININDRDSSEPTAKNSDHKPSKPRSGSKR
jgi:hypothetical protein